MNPLMGKLVKLGQWAILTELGSASATQQHLFSTSFKSPATEDFMQGLFPPGKQNTVEWDNENDSKSHLA